MRVSQIFKDKGDRLVTARPDDTIATAAGTLKRERIGAVMVVDERGELVGILSERDVLARVVAVRADPSRTRVEQVMSSPVICCSPFTTQDECRALMTVKRIRHVPVVQGTQLVGIVTSGDLLAEEVADQAEAIRRLSGQMNGPQM